MATYIIGDVHGCFRSLMALIDKIQFNPDLDKLVFVGDLVNKGPHSLEVLSYVRSLGNAATVVLGNHDVSLIASAVGAYQKPVFNQILQTTEGKGYILWLRQQNILWHDEQENLLAVHAGLPPTHNLLEAKQLAKEIEDCLKGPDYADYIRYAYDKELKYLIWSQENQKKLERVKFGINGFTRMRYCDEKGNLMLSENNIPKRARFPACSWYDVRQIYQYDGGARIFFGHWAALGLYSKPNYHCLDSGCVYGRSLTAVAHEKGEIRFVSVPFQ